jgi:hypothetical protein
LLQRRAFAAEFTLKLAIGQDPTDPVNLRAKEAIGRRAQSYAIEGVILNRSDPFLLSALSS